MLVNSSLGVNFYTKSRWAMQLRKCYFPFISFFVTRPFNLGLVRIFAEYRLLPKTAASPCSAMSSQKS